MYTFTYFRGIDTQDWSRLYSAQVATIRFPKWLWQFKLLPAVRPVLTSNSIHGLVAFVGGVAGVVSHRGFTLRFPRDWWGWAPFHTCSYFSVECPFKPFTHFSIVFLPFSYWLARVLYLWWIWFFLLLDMCIAVLGILKVWPGNSICSYVAIHM